MRINAITLRPYRNFDHLELCFSEQRVLIEGQNGRGKSNLLEAISYLSIGKSIRGAQDHHVVPHQGQYFDIEAECQNGSQVHNLRIYFSKKEGKRVFSDRSPLPRVADIIGRFKTVHFSPEDVSLVLRFAAQRRRLLDILISQASPEYLKDLQQYQRVLAQRNALLRMYREGPRAGRSATGPNNANDAALEAWNAQLAPLGGRIRWTRVKALEQLVPAMKASYGRFAAESVGVSYRWSGMDQVIDQAAPDQRSQQDDFIEALQEDLSRKKSQEIQQGFSLSGPHRDQLGFTLDGQAADTYASEGQLKTILIAWKIAEMEYLKETTQQQPVLLLDDLFSELDQNRIREIMGSMDGYDQVLLTTPQNLKESERFGFARIAL